MYDGKNIMKKFRSKLPRKVRDSLAKELKILLSGKITTLKIDVNLTVPVKVGYGWAEDSAASYNPLHFHNYLDKIGDFVENKIPEMMAPKIEILNVRINKFNSRLQRECDKYKADFINEFDGIMERYKLNDSNNRWG